MWQEAAAFATVSAAVVALIAQGVRSRKGSHMPCAGCGQATRQPALPSFVPVESIGPMASESHRTRSDKGSTATVER
ncbi:hypothetical protein FJZ36_00665 [Candidatus Poribacteria bacterium]|nr:hypothetical protein [Candidatus Poribacteria bacterium]